jgi:hypothetical protein
MRKNIHMNLKLSTKNIWRSHNNHCGLRAPPALKLNYYLYYVAGRPSYGGQAQSPEGEAYKRIRYFGLHSFFFSCSCCRLGLGQTFFFLSSEKNGHCAKE